MKLKNLWIPLGVAVVLAVVAIVVMWRSSPPSRYTVTVLPSLAGDFTLATEINENGQVVGFGEVARGEYHVFLWDRRDGMRDLGCRGRDAHINDLGQITGTTEANGVSQAFFYDPNDGMRPLGTMGGLFSQGHGINNRGQVVGSYTTADKQSHAFVWDRAGGMQTIDVPGCGLLRAWAIDDAGQTVVFGKNSAYVVALDESGAVATCEPLPIKGLLDISETGYVGGVTLTTVDGANTFDLGLWHEKSGLRTFSLDARDLDSPKINDAGQMVYSRTWDEPTGLLQCIRHGRPGILSMGP